MGKKQRTDDANYSWSASEALFMFQQIPCGHAGNLCLLFLDMKQNKCFAFFQSLVAIFEESVLVSNWAVPFFTGVCYIFLILQIVQGNKSGPKGLLWEIQKNRSTLLISLQLPAVKLCLWNKIPFCHYVLIIAVSLHLHTLLL